MRKITKSEYEVAAVALDVMQLTGAQKVSLNRLLDSYEYPTQAKPLTEQDWLAFDEVKANMR
jgi:hypothetical protein